MTLRRKLLDTLLATALLGALLLSYTPQASAAGWYENSYNRGMAMFKQGKYHSAIRHFRELLDVTRSNSLSDNCQFWVGEAYYQLGEYEQAIVEFDRTLTFPDTNKREDTLNRLGDCYRKLGKLEQARQIYLRLLSEYPKTRHAAYVLKTLEQIEAG